jgi:hypothetical protein
MESTDPHSGSLWVGRGQSCKFWKRWILSVYGSSLFYKTSEGIGLWGLCKRQVLWLLPWKSMCCGNLKLRCVTLRQFSRKQHFTVPAQTQRTCVQRLRGLLSAVKISLTLWMLFGRCYRLNVWPHKIYMLIPNLECDSSRR